MVWGQIRKHELVVIISVIWQNNTAVENGLPTFLAKEPKLSHDNMKRCNIPVLVEEPDHPGNIAIFLVKSVAATDTEAKMLRSYIDYVCRVEYQRTYEEFTALLERGWRDHNTITFWKCGPDDWMYMNYNRAPHVGFHPNRQQQLSLLRILDRIVGDSVTWRAWKSQRSELFGSA